MISERSEFFSLPPVEFYNQQAFSKSVPPISSLRLLYLPKVPWRFRDLHPWYQIILTVEHKRSIDLQRANHSKCQG